MIKNILLAGLGGAIGTMLRFTVYQLIRVHSFPLATLLINITGSLIIGIVVGFCLKDIHFENNWKTFFATGICGGFTTFSAFSAENMQLLQEEKYLLVLLYIFISVVLGIAAAWAGFKITTH